MIVAQLADSHLRKALRLVARREEDVFAEPGRALDALEMGFPRLLVRDEGEWVGGAPAGVPELVVDESSVRRWEADRRSLELPPSRIDFWARRLAVSVEEHALGRTWVDEVLADLTHAAGGALPPTLRGFGRRIMEFPAHYTNLHAIAYACGTSRGALKARFRRRGLVSPYTYQRWFRLIAVAHLLADRSVTVAAAARRAGFTSDGNLCRMIGSVCGMTPTDVRSPAGWNRLLITFAWAHLTPGALEAWSELDRLFELRIA